MNKLGLAVAEARRFIERANILLQAEMDKKEKWHMTPKESGACRRASLDLTRALADYRKDMKG